MEEYDGRLEAVASERPLVQTVTTTSSESLSAALPSHTIVERIAALEDTSPTDLSPPLYAVVDPDALDTLARGSTTERSRTVDRISFTYCGYDVDVRSGGEITIE